MMDQLKEQSKKASEKLEDLSKKTQKELEKTQKELEKASKKAQKSIEKTSKQTKDSVKKAMKETKDSVNKAVQETKDATESSGSSLLHSTKEAVHIEVKSSAKKVKQGRRKDSSDEEDGLLDDIGDEFDNMTLNQRLLGAIGCYALSGLFAFAATVMLCTGVHHVRFYAFFYSLSNLATFSSLIFIMGPERLQKRMLSRKRSKAGRAWMSALALTIVVAFVWPSHWFTVILLLVLQFGCMVWYSVSYYAFGRKFLHTYMAKRVVLVDAMDGKIDGK